MAFEEKARDISGVRIPADLNASLDRFFSALKLQVLDEAVRRASACTSADGVCVLRKEDLIATAREALPAAVSELDETLSSRELNHVRRAS